MNKQTKTVKQIIDNAYALSLILGNKDFIFSFSNHTGYVRNTPLEFSLSIHIDLTITVLDI